MKKVTYLQHESKKAGGLLVLLFCSWLSLNAAATNLPNENGTSFSITLSEAEPVLPDNTTISAWFQNLVQDRDISLQLVSQKSDPAGNRHYRYRQYYKDIPVAQSMVNIHYRDGKIYSANGTYFHDADAVTRPATGQPAALAKALTVVPAATYAWQDSLMVRLLQSQDSVTDYSKAPAGSLCLLPDIHTGKLKLAYSFDVFALEPMHRKIVYIDALNGQLLHTEEQLHTIDRTGTAHTRYSGVQNIVCDSAAPAMFRLTESGRGGGIATYNALKGYSPTTVNFTDDNNDWNNINPDQDEIATDVHWGIELAYDYFKNKLLRNSYDNANGRMIGMVHTGFKYNNANWNGTFAAFGDGDSIISRPLVTPDICIHELSHGITTSTAKLIYMDEMGALNESFSDIFAHGAIHYAIPATFSWRIAEAVQYSGLPMRDMRDPHNTFHPKFYHGLYYYTGTSDYGGVHTNSGVQNYWFYLLCEGGSGTRESDGAAFTVTPIGIEKAEQIAYSTLTDYLFPLAQYKDAATLSVTAAAALYGTSSDELRQIQMAWYAVGLADKPVSVDPTPDMPVYTVSPNPTSGVLYISSRNSTGAATLRLINLLGQTIHYIPGFNGNSLDISDLQNGIYLLELSEAGQTTYLKICKQ